MAKTYTSTIEVRCFKEHTCVCCGALYSYELVRTVKGTAGTAEKASANAKRSAAAALEREVDMEPCPTCGLLQPDMIGQRRVKRFKPVFWIALIVFAAIVIMRAAYLIQADIAIWAAAAAAAVAVTALWRIDTGNPNRNPEANRELAAGRVASGAVAHKPGKVVPGAQELVRPALSMGHRLTLVLLFAAVVMAAAPELVRVARHWPLNADCYPPVVGPGDQPRIYMDGKITSIKGYWRGRPQVAMHEAGSAGRTFPVTATTNQNDWGSTISAKSSEKNSSATPWVNVLVPEDASLAGKTATCDIQMNVEYPALAGSSNFQRTTSKMHKSVTMQLAPAAGAGSNYNEWWWEGTVGGMALILLCVLFLQGSARGLARQARPTRLLGPAAPAPATA
jgi:hypothetical protein